MTNSNSKLGRARCIVIHHKNFPDILDTLENLLESGFGQRQIILVDNSEEIEVSRQLRMSVPPEIEILEVKNMGYGAALNAGVDFLRSQDSLRLIEYILVATHEIRLDSETLDGLVERLHSENEIFAIGPKLHDRNSGNFWSQGGDVTQRLLIPRHRKEFDTNQECDWLDGALVLYRSEIFEKIRMEEVYFLYFEEVDFHRQIKELGGRVVCDNSLRAWQSTSGTPTKLQSRNQILFTFKFITHPQRLIIFPYLFIRLSARFLLRKISSYEFAQGTFGIIEGFRLIKLRKRHARESS